MLLLLLIIARSWVSTAHLRELIRRSCECLLPVGWRYLVLLEEVHADISFIYLSATNDADLRVHDHVIWDGEWLKVLAELLDLLQIVRVQQILFLYVHCIKGQRGTYIALKIEIS